MVKRKRKSRKPDIVGLGVLVPAPLRLAVRRAALERGVTVQRAGLEAWTAWIGSDPATFGFEPPNSPQ